MKYGFIGCGNMGSALAKALSKTTKDILLADHDTNKAHNLADALGVSSGSNEEIAKECERIFLGVKPQMMEDLLRSIAPILCEKKPTLISMAVGLSTDTIERFAGAKLPIIRIMPNTPVSVGKGVVLYCGNCEVDIEITKDFANDMQFAGILDMIDESLMDAGCSVSGCGPAFMYMFADAIARGGTECGLNYEQAVKYAAATMLGAAEMMLQGDKTPEQLREAVCSKGGSTIEGVKVLQNGELQTLVSNCVKASYKRNQELGK